MKDKLIEKSHNFLFIHTHMHKMCGINYQVSIKMCFMQQNYEESIFFFLKKIKD